jgi:hypothetical protein
MHGGRVPLVKCSRDTLDGFRPERVDADKSTAHAKGKRTDPAEGVVLKAIASREKEFLAGYWAIFLSAAL